MPKQGLQPNVIPVPEAARQKDCSRQTIYNALDRDDLTEYRVGSTRLVITDEKYARWQPQEIGGRVRKADSEANASSALEGEGAQRDE